MARWQSQSDASGPEVHRRAKSVGSILVKNLPKDTRREDLRQAFGKFGEIKDIYIPRNYFTGLFRGFAFVEFSDKKMADRALRENNAYRYFGKRVEVVLTTMDRKTPQEMISKHPERHGSCPLPRRSPSPRMKRLRSRSPPRSRYPPGPCQALPLPSPSYEGYLQFLDLQRSSRSNGHLFQDISRPIIPLPSHNERQRSRSPVKELSYRGATYVLKAHDSLQQTQNTSAIRVETPSYPQCRRPNNYRGSAQSCAQGYH